MKCFTADTVAVMTALRKWWNWPHRGFRVGAAVLTLGLVATAIVDGEASYVALALVTSVGVMPIWN